MVATYDKHETSVDEIEDGIFRISTPVYPFPSGFTFNQILIRDDEPLLFHTGPRALFLRVRDAVARVIRLEELRYIGISHVEADESGALNELLAAAPHARPLCGKIAAMISIRDLADKPPVILEDGEALRLGEHEVRWLDAPHVPHGWDCGYLMDETRSTLLCGDLFTQPGAGHAAVTEADILGPSEELRAKLDYYAYGPDTPKVLARLAQTKPRTLACMHGSAWRGDGAALLRELAARLAAGPAAG